MPSARSWQPPPGRWDGSTRRAERSWRMARRRIGRPTNATFSGGGGAGLRACHDLWVRGSGGRATFAAGGPVYERRIRWVGAGQGSRVIEELTARQQERGKATKEDKEG